MFDNSREIWSLTKLVQIYSLISTWLKSNNNQCFEWKFSRIKARQENNIA